MPADYEAVLAVLRPLCGSDVTFLEWGSATGVIAIMADLLGFEAYGIELDPSLVQVSVELARRYDSNARFASGSFLPAGYAWTPKGGDGRKGTVGDGTSGYLQLGRPLEDFDVVYGYPWSGEEPMMLDIMNRYGRRDALLLIHQTSGDVKLFRGGKLEAVVAGRTAQA